MNPLIAVAAALLPEILKLIARDRTGDVSSKVEAAVKDATGADTAPEAKKALDGSAQVSAALQAKLAEIALDAHRADLAADAEADRADLAYNTLQADDTQDARETLKDIIKLSNPTAYTPSAISFLIVGGFFVVLLVAISGALNTLAPTSLQIVNLLIGALTAAFATVLNFWLGSSLGSRRKDSASAQSDAVRQLKALGGGSPQAPAPAGAGPAGGSGSGGASPAAAGGASAHDPAPDPGGDERDDADDEAVPEAQVAEDLQKLPEMPKPVPDGNPVPFAQSHTPVAKRFWPVQTTVPTARLVSFETLSGKVRGSPGRRFLAQRNGGARIHVGIDLYARRHDKVVACEDGRIVNFYRFYPTSAGDIAYALLIEHADFVINYGEVDSESRKDFGWSIGDTVKAGQVVATISGTSMLHFEMYRTGTKVNARWYPDKARPANLYNPTRYLLELATLDGGAKPAA